MGAASRIEIACHKERCARDEASERHEARRRPRADAVDTAGDRGPVLPPQGEGSGQEQQCRERHQQLPMGRGEQATPLSQAALSPRLARMNGKPQQAATPNATAMPPAVRRAAIGAAIAAGGDPIAVSASGLDTLVETLMTRSLK